jgi:sugar transferase (PEP-CTERM/EpsH1 system associated)
MRVLFVCHRFPYPPIRGGKIRPFNIIRHLSQRHEVTVASLARSEEEAQDGEGLAAHCHKYLMGRVTPMMANLRMVGRLPTLVPSSMGYFYSPDLARRLAAEVAENSFDLIFVHCSSMAQYVERFAGIPKIMDFGDMDSHKWLAYAKVFGLPKSLGYWLEGWKLQREETRLASVFDFCTCTTRAELATLDDYGVGTPSGWFPNGVDLDRFQPSDEPYDPDSICFIGRMDYFPNQECMLSFCVNTLPLIRARRPSVKLAIIGAAPSPAIRRLGEIPGVTVTGTVPDVRPYVVKSAVNVAPLTIARGTQNKILESLAMGVPVVSSEVAAFGVDVNPGEHMLTATDHRSFADAVLKVLEDPGERSRLAAAGRSRMETNHSWEGSMRKLDGLIESCLQPTVAVQGRDEVSHPGPERVS